MITVLNYTNYAAVRKSLRALHEMAQSSGSPRIAIPYKIGCNRGGGNWDKVYAMIVNEFACSMTAVIICKKKIGGE